MLWESSCVFFRCVKRLNLECFVEYVCIICHSQGEGDGVVAVAGQEVGEDGLHGGFLLHLAVRGAQQVSIKHI